MNKQWTAVAVFAAVFAIAFWLGTRYSASRLDTQPSVDTTNPKVFTFDCAGKKSVWAAFHGQTGPVDLSLSDGRNITLPRAISASGARYANSDESIVFWNKGDTAFITENGTTTYADCVEK